VTSLVSREHFEEAREDEYADSEEPADEPEQLDGLALEGRATGDASAREKQ
jgi:hypothetical protein